MKKDISIIIPLYNEEEGIKHLISRLYEIFQLEFFKKRSIEILLIDDGSTDATVHLCREALHLYPIDATLYCHSRNGGQSKAIITGSSFAQGEYIALLDADLQSDPIHIPHLFQKIDLYDCVVGRREKRCDVWWKKILSKSANAIRRIFIEDGTLDSGSPLKLFKRECIEVIPHFNGVHRLLPAYFSMAGYSVTEVLIPHHERLYGMSKYSLFSRGISIIFDFLATAWLFRRKIDTKIEIQLSTLQGTEPIKRVQ
ncbi:MAG: glycosyltransferase [Chlamydia sp.]